MIYIVQTVSISADTSSKLTMKLNDWLKGWPEDRILDIQFLYCRGFSEPFYAFVTYRK